LKSAGAVIVAKTTMARPYAEPTLFRFAYAYEQATRHRRPPATALRFAGDL
jgi:Asp-tRNA(Asn)/Glu-tRNA(Gln) amidotransferase A subunit family amidase